MFVNATGVERDYAEAAKWYQLAADHGNVSAQFGLADMYIAGEGIAQDYEKAGKLYLSAAKQGNSEAQYNIGEMFAAGYGVQQNFILAYLWSEISAQTATVFHRGRATRNRDQIAEQMSEEQVNQAKVFAKRCLDSKYKDCDGQ